MVHSYLFLGNFFVLLRLLRLLHTCIYISHPISIVRFLRSSTASLRCKAPSIHFSNPRIKSIDSGKEKKKKKKRSILRDIFLLPSPPSSLLDNPQLNDRAAFPAPPSCAACMFHLEARSNYRLGEYRRRIRIPVDGPSYCEYRFQPGKKQICPRLLLPPRGKGRGEKKDKVDPRDRKYIRKTDVFS